jgi:hypothetical protein
MELVLKTNPQFLEERFGYLEDFLRGQCRTDTGFSKKGGNSDLRVFPQPVILFEQKKRKNSQPNSKSSLTGANKTGFGRIVIRWGTNLVILLAVLASLILFGPKVYYSLFSSQTVKQSSTVSNNGVDSNHNQAASNSGQIATDSAQVKKVYVPTKNPDLPTGDWLVIPRIGVRSELQPTEDPETALATGIWWVPDFGKPGEMDQPMIVAAHRYGWQWWWKTDYWRYHSFYNLPQTEPGDIVEVISGQRKWLYEIYAGGEGTKITDYEADLILYTCKFLNSPVRYFRYANLVVPEEASSK